MAETKAGARNPGIGSNLAGPVQDFKDLAAWKLARELRKLVYDISRKFPAEEKYVLVSQLRRAAISVTANIAEGFGRYSHQENTQFCRHARGSGSEVRDHLTTALDERYLSAGEWTAADSLAQRVIQVLNGYIRSTQRLQRERAAK